MSLLYSHLTNDELLKIAYEVYPPNSLIQELAFRLEHEYPNDLAVPLDEED